MSESKHTPIGTNINCPVCHKEFEIDDILDMGFIKRANSQPALLEACKDGVKFLDSLLAGNRMTEIQLRMLSENRMAFRKILEAAIAQAKKEG